MTTLSNQFNKLVKVALEEKQALTDNENDIQLEVMDDLQKAPICFMITIILINQSESTLQPE